MTPDTTSAPPLPSAADDARRDQYAAWADPLPDAVQWWEGMLLSPQHLQQNDMYWACQLRHRLSLVTPCHWGLAELVLDETRLASGVVVVKRLECVMPDGTPVIFPGHYTEPLELDLADTLPRDGKPLRVSLLMPRRSGEAGGGAPRRHEVVAGSLVADENTGAGPVAVDRVRPRIMLSADPAVAPHYLACPLFELLHRAETQRAELGQYHPPMLRWSASDFLRGASLRRRVRAVNEALWLKLRELGGDRRDDAPEDEGLGGRDQARQLDMARRLAAVLPRLGLLAARSEANPLALYDMLAEVVGVMASFGANPIAPMLEAYRHDDCEPQFRRALAYIERKLGYIDNRHEWLAFERTAPGRFERLLAAQAAGEWLVELRSAAGATPGLADRRVLEQWMEGACIASAAMQPVAQRLRVSARARVLSPAECARRQLREGALVFVIDNEIVDLPGHGRQALVTAGQPLVIAGPAECAGAGDAPADGEPALVLLVQSRGRSPGAHHG